MELPIVPDARSAQWPGGARAYEDALVRDLEQAAADEARLRREGMEAAMQRALDRSGIYNVGSLMLPQDAGEVALGAAMVPGPMGWGMRGVLAALGGMTTQPGEAEGALLVRARRALETGVLGRHGTRELEDRLTNYPRVSDAQEPTVRAYLDQMQNVLETPGRQMRVFEDPIDFIQGNREPEWMLALNPQRDSLTPYGHRQLTDSWVMGPDDEVNTNVATLLQDQRLLRMYPALEDVQVRFRNSPSGSLGSYRPGYGGTWTGEPPRIELYGHNHHLTPSARRGTWSEELQHAIQDLDGRGNTTANWFNAVRNFSPEELQAATTRFGGESPNDLAFRMYRAQPIEWEAGLVADRAEQRVALPRWFSGIGEFDEYRRLFEPEFHNP